MPHILLPPGEARRPALCPALSAASPAQAAAEDANPPKQRTVRSCGRSAASSWRGGWGAWGRGCLEAAPVAGLLPRKGTWSRVQILMAAVSMSSRQLTNDGVDPDAWAGESKAERKWPAERSLQA